MSENVSNKYGQKHLDSAKNSTTDVMKTASKRAIQKTAEEIGDLIGNKIVGKITYLSNKSSRELHSQNNEANDEIEILKERYMSPEKRQQIIDELRLA